MNLHKILTRATQAGAADIFIVPGSPISMKVGGKVTPLGEKPMTAEECRTFIEAIYQAGNVRKVDTLMETGDDDFSFSVPRLGRFRCNAYRQRGSLAAVLRVVTVTLPDPKALNIPDAVMGLTRRRRGIILVTGPAGSGKSTTLACMVDRINRERAEHIITLEDPIEFLHPHKRSLVSQREVSHDTRSYAQGLRAALRQSPNVILLGEMRDLETIQTALTAAETGQLILSSLHTVGAAKTIDRVLDVFPVGQQQQVRIQFSMALQAVVSQQLIPALSGELVPAFEVMIVNPAIANMIREGKTPQLDNVIYAGASEGMQAMDADIERLFREGKISRENALLYATNPDTLLRKLPPSR